MGRHAIDVTVQEGIRMKQGSSCFGVRARVRALMIVLAVAVLGVSAGAREQKAAALAAPRTAAPGVQAPFYISPVPTVGIPIRLGTNLGFNVSANTAGYANLYLINPQG